MDINKSEQEGKANYEKEIINELLTRLTPFKRTAYIPTTEDSTKCFSVHSKFGGFPYLRNAEDWPICPNCHNHMQLFLQLNLTDLPINKEDGLIQLFYCTNDNPICEIDCDAFFPFSKSVLCRRVSIGGLSFQIEPVIKELFDEKRIVGWTRVDDYPHYDELQELGVEIDIDEYEQLETAEIGIPKAGDKLYGWPHWIQSVEYPYDRKTGTRMELLFQIDSNVNLPYMFGDVGIGHLTESKDDPNELAFGWACS